MNGDKGRCMAIHSAVRGKTIAAAASHRSRVPAAAYLTEGSCHQECYDARRFDGAFLLSQSIADFEARDLLCSRLHGMGVRLTAVNLGSEAEKRGPYRCRGLSEVGKGGQSRPGGSAISMAKTRGRRY